MKSFKVVNVAQRGRNSEGCKTVTQTVEWLRTLTAQMSVGSIRYS